MATHARKDVWHRLTLAHFAGNPVFFFDTAFLLSKAPTLAGWSAAKLEAFIGPLIEASLRSEDTRYITAKGFYVVFGGYNRFAAHEAAHDICVGILRQLFGQGEYSEEAMQRLCAQSSVQNLVEDLGVPPPPRRRVWSESPGAFEDTFESHDSKPFGKELADLYRELVISDDYDGFRFWPCWDSQRQRITSFICDLDDGAREESAALSAARSLSPATTQCKLDIAALAAGSKGIRRIVRRCEPGWVSVPIHVETLSWSSTRDAYLSVLASIDPKFLALLSLRITGFAKEANLSSVKEWIAQFRPHVRGVSMEMNTALENSTGHLGLSGINLTITDQMRSAGAAGDALVEQVARLKRVCEGTNATASVHGVASLPELYLLKAHRVRIVSGPAIHVPTAVPGHVRPLSFESMSTDRPPDGMTDEERAILKTIAHLPGLDLDGLRYSGRA